MSMSAPSRATLPTSDIKNLAQICLGEIFLVGRLPGHVGCLSGKTIEQFARVLVTPCAIDASTVTARSNHVPDTDTHWRTISFQRAQGTLMQG
jgi:hypothetical protein